MKALLIAPVAFVAVLLATATAGAFGHRKQDCASPGCAAPMTCTMVEQTVTDYKTEWRTVDIKTTVDVMDYKEVAKKYTRLEDEVAYAEHTELLPVLKVIPHAAVKDVTTYKMVPSVCTESCGDKCGASGSCGPKGCGGGSCHTTFHAEPCQQQIPATRYEAVTVERPYVIGVPYIKQVEKTYEVLESVPFTRKVTLVRQERTPVQVPFVHKVLVPVWVPCSPAPPAGCCTH